jgi:predicted RND superfamily exporter protein
MEKAKEFQELLNEVRNLKRIVDALCNTNFLTEHKDGEEEIRELSVQVLNNHNRKVVDDYIAKKAYRKLKDEQQRIQNRIATLEQDNPELKYTPVHVASYIGNVPLETLVNTSVTTGVIGQTLVANNGAGTGTTWGSK